MRTTCKRSEVEHVRKFLSYAKRLVNDAWYYPPSYGYRYIVALALYSKCITVGEATLVLLDAGFSDEAFGMTRTLLDIFITLRYVVNNDTDNRAQRYAEFSAKDSEEWAKVVMDYWPNMAKPLDARTRRLAATFPNPHRWSGKSAKEMLYEPDTLEVDPATGKPTVLHHFYYRASYRWTSHYVHPTISALRNHLVQAGRDNFTVRSRNVQDMGHITAFNIVSCVVNTMIYFYRCMGDPQPDCLANWAGALIKHLARRHKRA